MPLKNDSNLRSREMTEPTTILNHLGGKVIRKEKLA